MIRCCFHKFAEGFEYPRTPPFDPPEIYPEFEKMYGKSGAVDKTNRVYPAVRELLRKLGLDALRFGTDKWRPFREFVTSGKRILIKPNLVTHKHRKGEEALFWAISHPSIIRALLDYAYLSVGSLGRIVIGDTPIEDCDFDVLCAVSGLKSMVEIVKERGYENLELLDLRSYRTKQYPDSSFVRTFLPGDPRGYTEIDLEKASYFQKLEETRGPQNYYTLGDRSVDHMNPRERKLGMSNRHHTIGRHVYRISNTILESDFIINIAKMKTHRFSGVTLCLKNAVGICEGKEYMPHRRPGTPEEGGDSFPNYPSLRYVGWLRTKRAIYSAIGGENVQRLMPYLRKFHPEQLPHETYTEPLYGDWHGNDTVWRLTLDLNLILCHADAKGFDSNRRRRAYFGVIDGIVGMDHEAPLEGLPVGSNLLIAGRDPVSVDTLGTYLMGFDPKKIRTITEAGAIFSELGAQLSGWHQQVQGNVPLENARCKFIPTKGWANLLTDEKDVLDLNGLLP